MDTREAARLVSNWEDCSSHVGLDIEGECSELNVDVSEFIRENKELSTDPINSQLWSLKNGQFLVKNHINSFYVLDIRSGTIKHVHQ